MGHLSLRAQGLSRGIIPLLILLNLCITIPLAAILNIWIDEAFSLHTSGGGLAYAARHALNFEMQPPLYFLLLSLWRSMNASPFFARLFSIVCISLTILIVGKVSKRFFKDIHPGWITASVALNPFVLWAAVEVRIYALVILLSSFMLLCFYDGYLSDTPRTVSQWLYTVGAILALYTQYYLGFLLVANAAALVSLKRWSALRRYLAHMMIVGLCFAPLVLVVLHQVAGVKASTDNARATLSEGLRATYWNTLKYLLPSGDLTWLAVLRKWVSRLGLIMVPFLVVKKWRRPENSEKIALWTSFAVLFVFFVVISVLLGEELLKLRHTAVIFLPTILCTFSLLPVMNAKKTLSCCLFVMLFFYAGAAYSTYAPLAKDGDWARVALYIMKSERPGEPIVVFRNEFVLPLSVYYRGPNQIVPIPREPDCERYDLHAQALENEEQISRALSRVRGGQERLWLVTGFIGTFRGVSINPGILEAFVKKNYSVVEKRSFYLSEVKLLQKKTSAMKQEHEGI